MIYIEVLRGIFGTILVQIHVGVLDRILGKIFGGVFDRIHIGV